MLASLLARQSIRGRCEGDRYAAWRIALERLRKDFGQGVPPGPAHLRVYLEEVPQSQRPPALEDLIALHLELTWSVSKGQLLESYLVEFGGEFEALSSLAVVPPELVEDEFLARYGSAYGGQPGLDEYQRRFSARSDVIERLARRCSADGRYVKLHLQGRGVSSEVWQAYDRHLGRPVAIKGLCGAFREDADAAARLAQETRDLAALEHPGIIRVHELHEEPDEGPWCVMPWIDGKTLGERIHAFHTSVEEQSANEARRQERQLLEAFADVCETVAYAHAHRVLHRDLKPSNILLTDFDQTVIVDWQRDVAGTPEYMSPEQVNGNCDMRSDVFGLGAVLYEILTGRPPYAWGEYRRPADWADQVRTACIVHPRQRRPKASRALAAIAMKALAPDPAMRYSSAADVGLEVRRFLAGKRVQVQRTSPTPYLWHWIGRGALRDLP